MVVPGTKRLSLGDDPSGFRFDNSRPRDRAEWRLRENDAVKRVPAWGPLAGTLLEQSSVKIGRRRGRICRSKHKLGTIIGGSSGVGFGRAPFRLRPNSPVRDRLDVLPGIDDRAGRRADARRRLMIGKRDSVRLFHSRPGTGNGQASKKCSWSTRMNRMLYPPSGVSGGDHCCAGAVAIVPARITSGNTLAPSRARRDGWATRSDESVICVSGRGSQFL